jgi:predicted nucleic acid-binding protein
MKRIVLDTNIIVSSALGGALELILDKWAEDAFTVYNRVIRSIRPIRVLNCTVKKEF